MPQEPRACKEHGESLTAGDLAKTRLITKWLTTKRLITTNHLDVTNNYESSRWFVFTAYLHAVLAFRIDVIEFVDTCRHL